MYIGSTGVDGLHHLVYEVVDNSVDEHMAGFGETIEVTIHIDDSVTVVDNGRGIPTGMHSTQKKSAAEVALTVLHAGGKFEQGAYTVSGGLHGVGISVVNALSEWLELEIWQDGQVFEQRYERGKATAPLKMTGKTKRRGTTVTFKSDGQIFETLDFSFDVLAQRLRELAFLNKGLEITLKDERKEPVKEQVFKYKGGIVSFVEHLNEAKTPLHKPIYVQVEKAGDGAGGRASIQRQLRREPVFFCEQHQYQGGRHALGGVQGRAHPYDQHLRERQRLYSRKTPNRSPVTMSVKGSPPSSASRSGILSSKDRRKPSWAIVR